MKKYAGGQGSGSATELLETGADDTKTEQKSSGGSSGNYQQYMKKYAGDYEHYMKQYSGGSQGGSQSQSGDYRQYMKKYAGDYEHYMKQYKSGSATELLEVRSAHDAQNKSELNVWRAQSKKNTEMYVPS